MNLDACLKKLDEVWGLAKVNGFTNDITFSALKCILEAGREETYDYHAIVTATNRRVDALERRLSAVEEECRKCNEPVAPAVYVPPPPEKQAEPYAPCEPDCQGCEQCEPTKVEDGDVEDGGNLFLDTKRKASAKVEDKVQISRRVAEEFMTNPILTQEYINLNEEIRQALGGGE